VKPKDVLPAWPAQSAWMRVQCCATMIQPFMSDEAYLELRTAICKWNLENDTDYNAKGGRPRKTA
jgi:hypothetical protein